MSREKRPAGMRETAIIIGFRAKMGLARLLLATMVAIAGALLALSAQADPYSRKIVVLDPGHGGLDTGTRGSGGLFEKEVTLALARQVAACLEPRYGAMLTRSGDYRLDGTDRVAMANAARADLFISFHAGGGFSPVAGGINVFYGGLPAGDALTGTVTEKTADAGVARAWDAMNGKHLYAGRNLAALLRTRLAPLSLDGDAGMRQAPLALLAGADMPAVLVEIGPITHPAVESRFQDSLYLSALAETVCAAVDQFFGYQ